ncbi:MAG: 30S ribosomal protein S12 methylthiotransferase RimO [Ardenticatenia bacterium]|nr:30S ribosomal protein S12 methylthiotransferase RimO [Ardenticatenia bacterium]
MGSYYLVTLGCPKNVADSEGMEVVLQHRGYRPAPSAEEADVLIVNTCGFLQAAREESLATLNALGQHKKPGQLLIAAGCLSERYGEQLADEVPALDGIIGTQQWVHIATLADHLHHQEEHHRAYVMPSDGRNHVADSLPRLASGHTAYLKIADGCSAPCAFCTIPAFKGPQRSKRPGAVLREAQTLAAQGVQEVILVAQDVTAYGRDWGETDGLPWLLDQLVHEVPDIPWIRLMYAYPGHVSDRLIEVMARHRTILHYLDIPLQHGHPAVLKRMRRPHKVERLYALFEKLRDAMPDICLRTTFIVGYPGETEEEFQGLLDFMSAVQFDKVGIFAYSPEPGTPSAELPDQVPEDVKQERRERAMVHQQRIALARQETQLGRTLEVLVDGYDPANGVTLARSYREAPEVDGYVVLRGHYHPGERLRVRITGAWPYDLEGRVICRELLRPPA